MGASEAAGLTVVFDGTCGPCTRSARWLRARDHGGRIEVVPSQGAGFLDRLPLSRAEADRAAWAIEPGGRRFEGAAAIARALTELGGGWRALGFAYRVPAVAALTETGYRWFAGNRTRFAWLGVTPECEEPGSACRE